MEECVVLLLVGGVLYATVAILVELFVWFDKGRVPERKEAIRR